MIVGFVFLAVNSLGGAIMMNAYAPEFALNEICDDLLDFAIATQFGWNFVDA